MSDLLEFAWCFISNPLSGIIEEYIKILKMDDVLFDSDSRKRSNKTFSFSEKGESVGVLSFGEW